MAEPGAVVPRFEDPVPPAAEGLYLDNPQDAPIYNNPDGFPRQIVGRPLDYQYPFERAPAADNWWGRNGLFPGFPGLYPIIDTVTGLSDAVFDRLGIPRWARPYVSAAASYAAPYARDLVTPLLPAPGAISGSLLQSPAYDIPSHSGNRVALRQQPKGNAQDPSFCRSERCSGHQEAA